MKYLKEFLEQQYKIRPLGELTSEEYYEVADYARWLEKRLSNYIENIESEI